MKAMVRRGVSNVAANLANAALTMGRMKLFAVFLGPSGIGYLNLIGSLVETLACLSGQGLAGVLNRELPRSATPDARRALVSTALMLSAGLTLALTPLLVWLFYTYVDLPGIGWVATVLVILTFAASTVWRLCSGLLFGLALSRRFLAMQVGSGLLALVLAWALLLAGVRDLVLLAALPPVTMMAVGVAALVAQVRLLVTPEALRRVAGARAMLAMALPLALGSLSEVALLGYVRVAASERLDVAAVGLLQPGVQFMMMSTLVVSSLTGMTLVRWDQTREGGFSRRSLALLAAAIAVPAVGSVLSFLLSPHLGPLVTLLFSGDFAGALVPLPWLLAGESFRIGGFFLMQTLISHRLNAQFLIPRIASLVVVVVAVSVMRAPVLTSFAIALFAAYAAFFLINLALWLRLHLHLRRLGAGLSATR